LPWEKNRTFEYLQENPHAVFLIVEQGETETLEGWKGLRVYLRMKEYATSGEMLDAYKRETARVVGEEAAAMVHAVVRFEVGEVRPSSIWGRVGRDRYEPSLREEV